MDTENWDNDSYIEEIDSLDESDDFGSEDDLYDFSVQSAPSKVERKAAGGSSKKSSSIEKRKLKNKSESSASSKREAKPSSTRQSNLKVEMKNISLPSETKDLIMDTLRSIHGENFSLDDSSIRHSKRKLSNQYWLSQGHLIVRNCYNYSNKKRYDEEKVSSLLLENLERYGFFTNHCYEALLLTNNDFEKSIQLLLDAYFKLNFKVQCIFSSKNLVEMDDELIALQSIFDNIVEVKVPHKYWVFHLELPYLANWYFSSSSKPDVNSTVPQRNEREEPLCRNFNLTGTCKFGSKCRFVHKKNSTEMKENKMQDVAMKLKSSFDLEIRFPDDCKYPEDVPLILLTAKHQEFSRHICLRISHYLIREASSWAKQGYPYCYNLLDVLLYNFESILKWLSNEEESKLTISPQTVLFKSKEQAADGLEQIVSKGRFVTNQKFLPVEQNISQEAPNRDSEVITNMKSKIRNPKYQCMQKQRSQLPAWNACSRIMDELNRSQVIVIVGDTGCGKTTQIPQFILDDWLFAVAGLEKKKSAYETVKIVCTQPRRLSAIGVATRVAQERIEKPGATVGYQIRLESCASSLTKLLFCTTGILLKKLEADPLLKSITHVIVDEVHERSEESDFLLLILKLMLAVRKDLKIILMSATLNAELFSSYFGGAPLIEIPGKMYPVTELYLEHILEKIDYTVDEYSSSCRKTNKTMSRDLSDFECDLAIADTPTARSISQPSTPDECLSVPQLFYRYRDYSAKTKKTLLLLDSEKLDAELVVSVLTWIVNGDHEYPRKGSILVFLPGLADIMAVNDELMGHSVLSPHSGNFLIVPLHSTISNEEQNVVFKKPPKGVRKIILSTNIAETSVTIDDCVFVVDSGKMKETRFDTNKNMSSLETMWISKANAKQRKGRAGRVMPGLCIRLYTEHRYQYGFTNQPVPEIQRVALDQVILRTKTLENLKTYSISDALEKLIEPPSLNSIDTAIKRLQDVGALDSNQELTALGRHLSVLPVDVKIGKLILFGVVFCCLDSVLTIAASLSNKSPFVSPFSKRDEAEARKKQFAICNSDHLTVLNAYNKWHAIACSHWYNGKRFASENFLSWKTLEMISDLKHQYLDLLVSIGFAMTNTNERRRHHEDRVLQMTPRELNKNGENNRLLSSIICAALYPNLVKILTPTKQYMTGISGAIPKEHTVSELMFKTKNDGYVFLHPSSVNHNVSDFVSPYLVYQEKMKTSKVFIHDSTMVSAVSLIMFAGTEPKIEMNSGMYTASLEDGWLVFVLRTKEDGSMLQQLRIEFDKLLEEKIKNPLLNLTEHETGKQIISTMVHLLTNTSM